MIKTLQTFALVGQLAFLALMLVQARSMAPAEHEQESAVIPSPNQDFGDEFASADLQRTSSMAAASSRPSNYNQQQPSMAVEPQASNEASVPIYVSPFNRAERSATTFASLAPLVAPPTPGGSIGASAHFDHSESSHAPPNYAPRPAASSAAAAADLKTSASYGHHHHGHDHHGYGYGPSGWLDMGAWTGGKGSFGWYADYPVGGKHHGYGRK